MKQAHTIQTKVDLTVPITPESITPEEVTDCFGTDEYNPQDSSCSLCSDLEICGIKFQELVKVKKKKFEQEKGPLLDMTAFETVNMSKIEQLAKKYEEESEPMTFEEIQKFIQEQAVTKDVEAVIEFIKRELPLTKMYLKDGLCLVR